MIEQYFTVDDVKNLISALKAKLTNLAVSKGIVASPDKVVIRTLLPKDLGAEADNWEQTFSASGDQTVYNGKVADDQIIVIFGIRNLGNECNVDHITFKTPTEVKDIWDVNPAKVKQDNTVISDSVVMYQNGDNFIIDFYENLPSGATSDTAKIQLWGLVAEPAGKTITKP